MRIARSALNGLMRYNNYGFLGFQCQCAIVLPADVKLLATYIYNIPIEVIHGIFAEGLDDSLLVSAVGYALSGEDRLPPHEADSHTIPSQIHAHIAALLDNRLHLPCARTFELGHKRCRLLGVSQGSTCGVVIIFGSSITFASA